MLLLQMMTGALCQLGELEKDNDFGTAGVRDISSSKLLAGQGGV